MNELDSPETRTTVSMPKSDMDNLKDMAGSFIEALKDKNKNEAEIQAKHLELQEKQMTHQQSAFLYKFWLLAFGLAIFLALSVALIFSKDKTDLGVSILSHIAAIIGGVVAGIGYANSKST